MDKELNEGEYSTKRFAPAPTNIQYSVANTHHIQQVHNETLLTLKASKTSELYEPFNNEAVSQRSIVETSKQQATTADALNEENHTNGSPYSAI